MKYYMFKDHHPEDSDIYQFDTLEDARKAAAKHLCGVRKTAYWTFWREYSPKDEWRYLYAIIQGDLIDGKIWDSNIIQKPPN